MGGPVSDLIRKYGKASHSHFNSVAQFVAGPALVDIGKSYLPTTFFDIFTRNGLFGLGVVALGVTFIAQLVFNELTHL